MGYMSQFVNLFEHNRFPDTKNLQKKKYQHLVTFWWVIDINKTER